MPDEAAVDKIVESVSFHENKDHFLQDFVVLANLGVSPEVTLFVEGIAISGTLIGGKSYFEKLGAAVGAATTSGIDDGGEITKMLSEGFAKRALMYVKPDDAEDDWKLPDPAYIHLENAKVFAPGAKPLPETGGMLFRAKINAVSGFSIGAFQVN